MSSISCTVEISNSSSSVLSDPGMLLLGGQCSVPLPPRLIPHDAGRASFTNPEDIDIDCLFTYLLRDQGVMLVVYFSVPFDRSKGPNDFAVDIIVPTTCNYKLLERMTMGFEKGTLRYTKAITSYNGLEVRATMSDTANAVLKVEVSNFPIPN